MKPRRHHNNKGVRQIRRGKTQRQVECIARRLGIKTISCDKKKSLDSYRAVI
jgi:hypothetical protein